MTNLLIQLLSTVDCRYPIVSKKATSPAREHAEPYRISLYCMCRVPPTRLRAPGPPALDPMASIRNYIRRLNNIAYTDISSPKQSNAPSRTSISSDRLDHVNPNINPSPPRQKIAHFLNRFQGWRGVTLGGAAISSVTLLSNIIVTIWAVAGSDHPHFSQGTYMIDRGSCDTSRKVNTGWHVLINILSTLLLRYRTVSTA